MVNSLNGLPRSEITTIHSIHQSLQAGAIDDPFALFLTLQHHHQAYQWLLQQNPGNSQLKQYRIAMKMFDADDPSGDLTCGKIETTIRAIFMLNTQCQELAIRHLQQTGSGTMNILRIVSQVTQHLQRGEWDLALPIYYTCEHGDLRRVILEIIEANYGANELVRSQVTFLQQLDDYYIDHHDERLFQYVHLLFEMIIADTDPLHTLPYWIEHIKAAQHAFSGVNELEQMMHETVTILQQASQILEALRTEDSAALERRTKKYLFPGFIFPLVQKYHTGEQRTYHLLQLGYAYYKAKNAVFTIMDRSVEQIGVEKHVIETMQQFQEVYRGFIRSVGEQNYQQLVRQLQEKHIREFSNIEEFNLWTHFDIDNAHLGAIAVMDKVIPPPVTVLALNKILSHFTDPQPVTGINDLLSFCNFTDPDAPNFVSCADVFTDMGGGFTTADVLSEAALIIPADRNEIMQSLHEQYPNETHKQRLQRATEIIQHRAYRHVAEQSNIRTFIKTKLQTLLQKIEGRSELFGLDRTKVEQICSMIQNMILACFTKFLPFDTAQKQHELGRFVRELALISDNCGIRLQSTVLKLYLPICANVANDFRQLLLNELLFIRRTLLDSLIPSNIDESAVWSQYLLCTIGNELGLPEAQLSASNQTEGALRQMRTITGEHVDSARELYRFHAYYSAPFVVEKALARATFADLQSYVRANPEILDEWQPADKEAVQWYVRVLRAQHMLDSQILENIVSRYGCEQKETVDATIREWQPSRINDAIHAVRERQKTETNDAELRRLLGAYGIDDASLAHDMPVLQALLTRKVDLFLFECDTHLRIAGPKLDPRHFCYLLKQLHILQPAI